MMLCWFGNINRQNRYWESCFMGPIYDVVITTLAGAAPADGFIDPKSSYQYMDQDGDAPDSLAAAQAKFRANRRFKRLVNEVNGLGNAYLISAVTTGATADTAATSITIRFQIEHSFTPSTPDESNPGTTLTGPAAIKRAVARALVLTETNVRCEYYDPTLQVGRDIDGDPNAGQPKGAVIRDETIGACAADLATAEAAITVTLV